MKILSSAQFPLSTRKLLLITSVTRHGAPVINSWTGLEVKVVKVSAKQEKTELGHIGGVLSLSSASAACFDCIQFILFKGVFAGIPASGTPLAWTTNDKQSEWYNAFNVYGDHFWILDVSMDCSKTEAGWFEFKVVSRNDQWESDISQDQECGGDTYRAQRPYPSNNHLAMCGKINVFHYKDDGCIVNDF